MIHNDQSFASDRPQPPSPPLSPLSPNRPSRAFNLGYVAGLGDDPSLEQGIRTIARTPRVIGTPQHAAVRDFLVEELKQAGFTVTLDRHAAPLPPADGGLPPAMEFISVIATLNPNAAKQLVVACHYDTLYKNASFARRFVGAMDSAVPCGMTLFIGGPSNRASFVSLVRPGTIAQA